ncbi:MAG: RecQ family ATP-dependent DNA helicase [Solirubrobacteraceae bacterium]
MDTPGSLRQLFGFESFRPGQAEAVQAGLDERDALVVMPTGSGKSLCYQLPALMRDDLTLVVSPLVSLMHDQVTALEAIAPGRVALVNAQRGQAANAEAVRRAYNGELRLLYVAPERFGAPAFAQAMAGTRIGLFVVDEAHCVSQWGHDFRPDYFTLADAAQHVGARATMALTATATPQVADDIVRRLRLRDPARVTTGFDRPNLSFAVVPCRGGRDKERRLAAALSEPDALPAIVYAGTRGATEELAAGLSRSLGEPVLAYHAGMHRGDRSETQERFMSGQARAIVATNAFGMGIDKSDVRTVCHASVPGSLEAYYQEAGRAGRDGRPARCLLFAEQRDKGLHVFFIQRAKVTFDDLQRVGEKLNWAGVDGAYDVPLSELSAHRGAQDSVRAIVGHLARAGVLAPRPAPPDRAAGRITAGFDRRTAALCMSSAREAEQVRWAQYRAIWQYVEGVRCRRAALLAHFGDRSAGAPEVACCDVCAPSSAPADPGPASQPKLGLAAAGDLDQAILEVVLAASPPVGRTRTVEILRGGRSKVVAQNAYDGLDGYGTFAHLRSEEVLGRVDELLHEGRLRSTGGRFPKLQAA